MMKFLLLKNESFIIMTAITIEQLFKKVKVCLPDSFSFGILWKVLNGYYMKNDKFYGKKIHIAFF